MPEYPKITIETYSETWTTTFKAAEQDISEALGRRLTAIEHIGSTAVPGLAAKPIIDIMAAVESFPDSVPRIVEPLAAKGFTYVDKGRSDRHFFRRGPWGHGTHHLHVVEYQGRDWRRQVFFRDWLRTHPEARSEYETLKRKLANELDHDRPAYKQTKTDFIMGILSHTSADETSNDLSLAILASTTSTVAPNDWDKGEAVLSESTPITSEPPAIDARDEVLMSLNLYGLRNNINNGRARMDTRLTEDPDRSWHLILATGQPGSPFELIDDQIVRHDGPTVAHVEVIEHDDARLGYARDGGRALTANTNRRSTCTECTCQARTGIMHHG